MGNYKPLCGFTSEATKNLSQRYSLIIAQDCTWKSREEFLAWVSEVGYIKGAPLRKRDKSKPHSPENTYFFVRPKSEPKKTVDGCPCVGCANRINSCETHGCEEWWRWFPKNWNEHIHQDIPKHPVERLERQTFRYEHPDLVREGIVFEV